MFTRRLMKFLHTAGAIGFMGSMACFLVMLSMMPAPEKIAEYALMRGTMGAIAKWIFLPSLGLTLIAGLLAMAVNPVFHNAGWALTKLVTGVLIFEWGFVAVQGPMEQGAELSAQVLAGQGSIAELALTAGAERNSMWILLGVAVVNIVLGVWRPRFKSLPE